MTRKIFLVLFAGALIAPTVVPAMAGDLDHDLAEARSRMASLKEQASAAEADRTPLLNEVLAAQDALDAAELEMSATRAKHDDAVAELADTERRLGEVQEELNVRSANLEVLRGEVERTREEAMDWVVEAYVRGGMAEPAIAFAAEALAEISIGIAYLELLTGVTNDAAAAFQRSVDAEAAEERRVLDIEAQLVDETSRLELATAEFDATLKQLEEQRAVLAARAAQQNARLAEIDHRIDEFENELEALARDEASIRAAIKAASSPAPRAPGALIRPVPGDVESGFGPRVHPILGTVRMHTGVDMHGPQGTPIVAAGDGVVIVAGVKGDYGNTVMIDHGGGMVTLYAHQSKVGVSVGQRVTQGQVIGWIGSSGLSTGPHLHFEVRINGDPKNPLNYW